MGLRGICVVRNLSTGFFHFRANSSSLHAKFAGWLHSELESPLKTLLDILQPAALVLPPPFGTICIQSAIKVFGFWASEQAREGAWNGDEDRGKEVVREVKRTEDGLRTFVSGGRGDVEVMERVSDILLFGSGVDYVGGVG